MKKNNLNQPLISIIIVTYNAFMQLEKSILSILNQSYQNTEIIIVDGNSTDGTIDIINKYNDQITDWISEPDSGVYDAMNKGIRFAKGDYIYFLGAGDIIFNVLVQISSYLTNQNQIIYGDVYRTGKSKIYDGKFSSYKFAVKNICHQSIFYPTKVLQKYRYDLKYKIQADYDLNMRCFGDKKIIFKYVPITIAEYEGGGYSDAHIDFIFFQDKLKIIASNFSLLVFIYAYLRTTIAKTFKLNIYQVNKTTR